jgi:hypothetical protein
MFGIDDAIAAGLKVLDKFIPDSGEKAKAEGELRTALLQWDQGQMAVNAKEAENANLFVSGARPYIVWVCGAAFSWHFVLAPITNYFMVAFGHKAIEVPFDINSLMTVLLGLLGLGGLRTYEKIKGVSK